MQRLSQLWAFDRVAEFILWVVDCFDRPVIADAIAHANSNVSSATSSPSSSSSSPTISTAAGTGTPTFRRAGMSAAPAAPSPSAQLSQVFQLLRYMCAPCAPVVAAAASGNNSAGQFGTRKALIESTTNTSTNKASSATFKSPSNDFNKQVLALILTDLFHLAHRNSAPTSSSLPSTNPDAIRVLEQIRCVGLCRFVDTSVPLAFKQSG